MFKIERQMGPGEREREREREMEEGEEVGEAHSLMSWDLPH